MEYGGDCCFSSVLKSRAYNRIIKFWYFRPVEAMEILGCYVSRAGWSVMLCGYMEWNLWPQFDQKRCQHMLANPTCRTGNAYQGGIVLKGASYSRVEIWYHLGSRKNSVIQTWPSLRIRKLNRQPNASKKYAEQLIQWSSKIPERSWWLMRETRLYVYSRNHCLRSCGLKGS